MPRAKKQTRAKKADPDDCKMKLSEFLEISGIAKTTMVRRLKANNLSVAGAHTLAVFIGCALNEYEVERTKKMKAQAEMAAREADIQAGKLYDADMVNELYLDTLRAVVSRLNSVPVRFASEVDPSRPDRGRKILDRAMTYALQPIANDIPEDQQKQPKE